MIYTNVSQNLLGKISTTDLLLESNLHTRVLQARLTPNLGMFFPTIKEEHDFAVKHELPSLERKTISPIYLYKLTRCIQVGKRSKSLYMI